MNSLKSSTQIVQSSPTLVSPKRKLGITFAITLSATLFLAGTVSAHGRKDRQPIVVTSNAYGHVEVVHQIPGGTIIVGAGYGRPRHKRHHREVTIIREEPRREVTVINTIPSCHRDDDSYHYYEDAN